MAERTTWIGNMINLIKNLPSIKLRGDVHQGILTDLANKILWKKEADGATDGQVRAWDETAEEWLPVDQSGGVSAHGSLSGLGNDDHTQYHNDARGDARYYQQSEVDDLLPEFWNGASGVRIDRLQDFGDIEFESLAAGQYGLTTRLYVTTITGDIDTDPYLKLLKLIHTQANERVVNISYTDASNKPGKWFYIHVSELDDGGSIKFKVTNGETLTVQSKYLEDEVDLVAKEWIATDEALYLLRFGNGQLQLVWKWEPRHSSKLRTGTDIKFDVAAIYNRDAAASGTFTINTTGLRVGVPVIYLHNDSSAPALPGGVSLIGGAYVNSVDNYLFLLPMSTSLILAEWKQVTGVGDSTPPALSTSTIENSDPTKIVLTYNEALDSGSVPATGDFTVNVNSSPVTVSGVNVTGSAVEVTIPAVSSGDTVTLDYTPGTNPIRDAAANNATALSGRSITNNVSGGTAITFSDVGSSLTTSGDDVYKNNGAGSGWANSGFRSSQTLTGEGAVEFFIQEQVLDVAVNNIFGRIGLIDTGSLGGSPDADPLDGVYFTNGTAREYNAGSSGSTISGGYALNQKWRVYRDTSNNIKVQFWSGSSWDDKATVATGITGTLKVAGVLYTADCEFRDVQLTGGWS